MDRAEISRNAQPRSGQVRARAGAGPRGEPEQAAVLLRDATLSSGQTADVLLQAGQIAAVGPQASSHPAAAAAKRHDLAGYLLLPSAAEPHAHLDKALLGEQYPNEPGDLLGAVQAMRRAYPAMDEAGIRQRAYTALMTAVAHGYTAVRTHAVCEAGIGTRAVRALCALRDEVAELADLQVVAMIGTPLTGRAGARQRALLDEALALGADLVGGAPALDDQPTGALRLLTSAAAGAGLPVDLHIDETTDPGMLTLRTFISEAERLGLSGQATASHCVSLGQQDPAVAAELAAMVARAGISVVTLPQTNLMLQGRAVPTRVPRALTAVAALRDAGVVLAGGGDNWRDSFNPLGRIDPMETAALLATAAHFPMLDAYEAVSGQARLVMRLPAVTVRPGSPADLLAIRASSLSNAVASADANRWVFRRGHLVSRTRLVQETDPSTWLSRDHTEQIPAAAAIGCTKKQAKTAD